MGSKQKNFKVINNHLRRFELLVGEKLEAARVAKRKLLKEQLRAKVLEELQPEKLLREQENAKGTHHEPVTFRDWYEVWAKNNRGRVSEKHLKNGRTVVEHLEKFAGEGFTPSVINEAFIADYHEYLAETEEIFDRTAAKHIGCIKSTLTQAGINVHGLDWLDIAATKSSAGIVFTREEQAKIAAFDPETASAEALAGLPKEAGEKSKELRSQDLRARRASLSLAKDLMVFIFKTGPRWSDLHNLDPSNVYDFDLPGGQAVKVLEYYQIKGGKQREFPCRVALDQEAAAIVAKYQGKQKKLLPVPSNQKLNEALKEVCRLAGIKAPVKRVRYKHGKRVEKSFEKWELASCHRCRATCATNLFEGGANDRTVQDVLGHDDPRSTRIYVRNADREQFAKTLAAFERIAKK
ncbi:tyrosine-type recombinase/integrase [Rufibacter latericius]|uniref:Tyr recombinase domain-containing protein n=1 Tax=Rufibacter latericius TaxID=2487040 RepID=A0A3M9MU84_9BACT|nr:tyrosine-type recombinase/integrase [Rufibacter latericius]RNI29080.1 hypothetical protein EFB08_06520 [Rufibacter latericius]